MCKFSFIHLSMLIIVLMNMDLSSFENSLDSDQLACEEAI